MFINLGTADGFDKGKMLGYICGISGVSGELIGRMLIKDVYSFVDIEPDHFEQVKNSFNNANYKGRSVSVWTKPPVAARARAPIPHARAVTKVVVVAAVATKAVAAAVATGGGGYQGGGSKGGGGYQGGDRGDRPQSGGDRGGDRPQSGGYRGNNDRGGYQKKEGFYEPKPKFPKKERKG
jgi:ATP-dependent RNA helicase DeaD